MENAATWPFAESSTTAKTSSKNDLGTMHVFVR